MERTDIKLKLKNRFLEFTSAERAIAKFFIENDEKVDLSSKNISTQLYVSEASLSRFAQKCGYKGYREFAYEYDKYFDSNNKFSRFHYLTQKVLGSYQELLDNSFDLVNEDQMRRIADILSKSKAVYIYGMGSSGFVAREMMMRFMRTGMIVEDITDSHIIRMNAALLDETMTVIALSLSGNTPEIQDSVKLAKKRGAKIVLVTGSKEEFPEADEVLRVAQMPELSSGIGISPQFPLLVMIDIFYSYYFYNDKFFNRERYAKTLDALNDLINSYE